MKNKSHIASLFDAINGGDDVDAAAEAQMIVEGLLAALIDLLGDAPDIDHSGECRHCGRDFSGELKNGDDCPSDDCPGFMARAAINKAKGWKS